MQIKTIQYKQIAEGVEKFDKDVNAALDDGWQLVRREPLPGYDLGSAYYAPTLYAELVKRDPPAEPMTWQEAARVLTDTCTGAEECNESCPMYDWCEANLPGNELPPNEWVTPMPGEAVQL